MTLKCPKCGGKRVIFLSTTDGTAIGSTDQRYLCKDCGYTGSLILEDKGRSVEDNDTDKIVKEDLKNIKRAIDDDKKSGKKEEPKMLAPETVNILFYLIIFCIVFSLILGVYYGFLGESSNAVALAVAPAILILAVIYIYKRK